MCVCVSVCVSVSVCVVNAYIYIRMCTSISIVPILMRLALPFGVGIPTETEGVISKVEKMGLWSEEETAGTLQQIKRKGREYVRGGQLRGERHSKRRYSCYRRQVECPPFAFTRYCLTLKLVCASQSSYYCPPPLALPTLLQYYCTSIAQYATPPTPRVCATHHIQYW